MPQNTLQEKLRIVTAFALKDIRDAIQNKMILRIGIGTLMVWLSAMALPILMAMRSTLEVRIFDPDRSDMIRELAKDNSLDVRRVRSQEELDQGIGINFSKVAGLEVEPRIDELILAGDQITLQGYYPHWMSDQDVEEMFQILDGKLSQIAGTSIRVDYTDGARFPTMEMVGQSMMVSSSLVIVLFTVGGMLTPFLMIEEKEKGTLAAILVSPASQAQFVLGKAIAGMFYTLIVGAVALSMSSRWVVHWDLMILTVVAGSLFTVALGLLVGVFTENPSSMGLWFGLLMIAMLIPVFLEFSPPSGALAWWQVLLKWLPSVGFADLIRATFTETIPQSYLIRGFMSMLITSAGLLAIVIWRIRRLEV
jgi:ABC-2 type transport system permease protein